MQFGLKSKAGQISAKTPASPGCVGASALAFIDPRVERPGTLVAGVRPDVLPVLLDPTRSGWAQANEVLMAHPGVREIHIIAHGEPGWFQWGSQRTSAETLEREREMLSRWREFLTPDAQILIYGCRVGATAAGRALVETLHDLTGAAVAASREKVGCGNWSLEVSAGKTDAAPPFSAAVCRTYRGQFNPPFAFVEVNRDGEDDGFGNTIDGLAGGSMTILSPDGNFLYATGFLDDTIATFSRDAATGRLTFVEFDRDGEDDGFGNIVDGLDNPSSVTVSSDGNFLYVAGSNDDAIATFSRNVLTGALAFVEVDRGGFDDGFGNTVNGLNGADSVTVSPDGNFLYAAGPFEDAIVTFSRNAVTGALAFVEVDRDGGNDGFGSIIDGLDFVSSVTVSPDGNFLYAAGQADDAIATFSRNPATGELTFVEIDRDGFNDGFGNIIDGLDGANSVVVSQDGNFLYAVSATDSAIATFSRNAATGALTFVDVGRDGGDDGFGNTIDGLDFANLVTLSPDGNFLYAGGGVDLGFATFSRNAATGELTFVEVTRDGQDDGFGNTIEGLIGPQSIVASPDGNFLYVGSQTNTIAVFGPPPGVTITPTSGITSEAGGSAEFSIVLNTQPAADVTFSVTSSDASEGLVSASSFTFTPDNWNVPQTLTVTGVDDALTDGNVAYDVLTGVATSADAQYDGLDPTDLALTNNDNDSTPLTSPVFRFFNTIAGGHFFTASEAERDFVINNLPQFVPEAIGFNASTEPAPGLVPVFRFFNTIAGGHFFTANEAERDFVTDNLPQFVPEGISVSTPTQQMLVSSPMCSASSTR